MAQPFMTRTGLWRIALPLYDVPDAGGASGADEGGGDSLADHEANFGPGVVRERVESEPNDEPEPEPAPAASDARERDATGKFTKPRHRAKSQAATAEDAPRIAELTGKWRSAERERDDARRELEALRSRSAEPAREPAAAAAEPPKPTRPEPSEDEVGTKYPTYAAFVKDLHKWEREQTQAADDARYSQMLDRRDAERAFVDTAKAVHERGRKAYPDFDEVLQGPGGKVPMGRTPDETMRRTQFIIEHPQSEHIQYAILKDEDLGRTLQQASDYEFGAIVSSLVATEQRSPSPSRTAAATTRSAPALVKPAPKPPNLVRTNGAPRSGDEPPADDSLAEHERAFGPKRRRA